MTDDYDAELEAKMIEFSDAAKRYWEKRGTPPPPRRAAELAKRWVQPRAS